FRRVLFRSPVEGALEHDNVRAPGRLPGQLDRRLDRLRAAVGEEERVKWRGYDGPQLLDEPQHRRVKDDVGLPVQQAGGLLLHGGDDARVAVAGVRHADAGGEVEVALARLVVEAAALGPLDDYLRQV